METILYLVVVLLLLSKSEAASKDDYIDVCLDAKHHKTSPGPESDLFKQCTPWKNHSCCTSETSSDLHEGSLYSLNYNHCPGRQKLSEACLRHFTQDHCFYECSPNVGPWIVEEPGRTWRNERYYGVPLCESDCNNWFNDCKDDFTCVENWSRGFTWITINNTNNHLPSEGKRCPGGKESCKINVCPKGSSCVTFLEMYGKAKNFCEKVWDGSWSYASDKSPCMRLWFPGNTHNPNTNIAKYYAEKRVANGSFHFTVNIYLFVAVLFVLTFMA